MNDLIDEACADSLNVSVGFYISRIEKTTHTRADLIIRSLLSEDEKIIEKAKRIFNLIKQ